MASIHNTLFSKLEAILGNIPEDKWDRVIWAELFQYGNDRENRGLVRGG